MYFNVNLKCYSHFLINFQVKIWFQNRRARERRDKEAIQRNHQLTLSTTKTTTFQPLSIPTVAWPLTSNLPATLSPAHLQSSAMDLRRQHGFLQPGLSFFRAAAATHELRNAISNGSGGGFGRSSVGDGSPQHFPENIRTVSNSMESNAAMQMMSFQ